MISRRLFLSAAAGLSFSSTATLAEKADALEERMIEALAGAQGTSRARVTPALCRYARPEEPSPIGKHLIQQGHDPALPRMPDRPTLLDFFKLRLNSSTHLLQSAKVAREAGMDDETVLACLLHDISVIGLIGTDHGYWAAQMLEPYVPERVSWAIRYHQALRFFADPAMGYEYPEAYIRFFGEDFEPQPYLVEAERYARKHKWYATSKNICINDFYAFDPDMHVEVEEFEDVIGRLFRQPEEGLGYDGSPVAHMWRTMIFPTNFL
jgi:hypothetical protein